MYVDSAFENIVSDVLGVFMVSSQHLKHNWSVCRILDFTILLYYDHVISAYVLKHGQ